MSLPVAVGGCLSLHWQVWSDKGADPWVVEVLLWGYRIPFRRVPTLSKEPIPYPACCPDSIRGKALEGGSSFSVGEGGNRAGFPSFSRLLQPVICGDESLRVVEASNRPLATESEGSEDILQDGDSPVCASVSTA